MLNQKFGKWLVIEKTNARTTGGCVYWLCRCECGKTSIVTTNSLRTGKSTQCRSCASKGWTRRSNLGARINRKGYVVLRGIEHPNAKGKQILEHVFVMSEQLGRPLLPGETVHHKNGVKTDNQPSNLELWSNSHPTGCRVEDLVIWAKHILEQYQ